MKSRPSGKSERPSEHRTSLGPECIDTSLGDFMTEPSDLSTWYWGKGQVSDHKGCQHTSSKYRPAQTFGFRQGPWIVAIITRHELFQQQAVRGLLGIINRYMLGRFDDSRTRM